MGGACSGSSAKQISAAVNHFTYTPDTFWDYTASFEFDKFMTRQITSVDAGAPVI